MKKKFLQALFLMLFSCQYPYHITIIRDQAKEIRHSPRLNFHLLKDALKEGYFQDLQRYLASLNPKYQKAAPVIYAQGRLAYHRGDLRKAETWLTQTLKTYPRSTEEHQEAALYLMLTAFHQREFSKALKFARETIQSGVPIDSGFLAFLESGVNQKLYYVENPKPVTLPLTFQDAKLVFFPIQVGSISLKAILDTGASMTLLSESLAKSLGIPINPKMKGTGMGLYEKPISIHFAWLPKLCMGGLCLENIPVMVFPDTALTFPLKSNEKLRVDCAVGFHLLSLGKLVVNYPEKTIQFQWQNPLTATPSKKNNLYLDKFRFIAEGSLQKIKGYHFIVDTGSESTFLTSHGLKRAQLEEKFNFFRMLFRGIGHARLIWRKAGDVTLGIAGYAAFFKSISVKSERSPLVDGYIGNDLLSNFKVTFHFPSMTLTFQPPSD